MLTEHKLSKLDALIGQFFQIENTTYGDEKQPFVARYQGKLKHKDSVNGYDQISAALEQYDFIAILRQEDNTQSLMLLPKIVRNSKNRPRLNLLMFLLTLLSVLFTGGLYGYKGELPASTNARRAAIGLHSLIDGLFANYVLSPELFDLMEQAEFTIDNYLPGLVNRK